MKFLFLLFLSLSAGAQTKRIEAPINMHMHEISSRVHSLLPYFVSEEEFANEKNSAHIKKYLSELLGEFKKIKKHPSIKTPGFRISRGQIEENLKDVISSFETNHKEFARYRLNSTFGLCISCHTQLPTGNKLKLFNEESIDMAIKSDFDKAEIYFITRDFKLAIENYDRFINNFGPKDEEKKLEVALNRKLSYYTRINRGYEKEAIAQFSTNMKNANLPIKIKQQIDAWIKALEENTDNHKDMKLFLAKLTVKNSEGPMVSLYSYEDVKDLQNSGYLFEYLNSHPQDPLVPEILFNLAVIDKRLNFDLFYSLGDLYLLECIENHSKSAFAKKCYQEYEDETIFSYTGSSGTSVPSKVKEELKRLKKKVGL